MGVIAGGAAGHYGMGAGIGAAAGAAAGMAGVLLSRGPDAVLAKGQTLEMVLDRAIRFEDADLNFGDYRPHSAAGAPAVDPNNPNRGIGGLPVPRRR